MALVEGDEVGAAHHPPPFQQVDIAAVPLPQLWLRVLEPEHIMRSMLIHGIYMYSMMHMR